MTNAVLGFAGVLALMWLAGWLFIYISWRNSPQSRRELDGDDKPKNLSEAIFFGLIDGCWGVMVLVTLAAVNILAVYTLIRHRRNPWRKQSG